MLLAQNEARTPEKPHARELAAAWLGVNKRRAGLDPNQHDSTQVGPKNLRLT